MRSDFGWDKTLEHNHYKETLEHIFGLGYFDQNHFIKKFKEFSLTTPKKYIIQGTTGNFADEYIKS